MKLPAAVLALQKLNELGVRGLNRNTTMITGKAAPGQTPVYNDPSSNDGRPTVAQYIPKIFLVSDNDAYNRLYKFVGQEYLNCALYKMGYNSIQLQHRLQVSLTEEQNRLTNPVTFFDTVSQRVYTKVAEISNLNFLQGKKRVSRPFDFSKKNRTSLPDLHSILQSVIFPEAVSSKLRSNLKAEDYRFLLKAMSILPSELGILQYNSKKYDDA